MQSLRTYNLLYLSTELSTREAYCDTFTAVVRTISLLYQFQLILPKNNNIVSEEEK